MCLTCMLLDYDLFVLVAASFLDFVFVYTAFLGCSLFGDAGLVFKYGLSVLDLQKLVLFVWRLVRLVWVV